jgi:AraC-like DNA-binding protein
VSENPTVGIVDNDQSMREQFADLVATVEDEAFGRRPAACLIKGRRDGMTLKNTLGAGTRLSGVEATRTAEFRGGSYNAIGMFVDRAPVDECRACPFERSEASDTAARPPRCSRALTHSIVAGRTLLSDDIQEELRSDDNSMRAGLMPAEISFEEVAVCVGALIAQVTGSSRIEQFGRTCTLYPGDWCLIEARHSFECRTFDERNECLIMRLEGPFETGQLTTLRQAASRRCSSAFGLSRILMQSIIEAVHQTDRMHPCRRTRLKKALINMTWDAVREQLDSPLVPVHRNITGARIKAHIEQNLVDPELSVNRIATSCGMSIRTAHRAFESDPAGSVSGYIRMRRLSHCAASLRDPNQAHRSITDICFSCGFNSTSHFSRLFKENFGVSPREYRTRPVSVSGTHSLAA